MFSRLMFAITFASICLLGVAIWQALNGEVATFVIRGDLTDLERLQIRHTLSDTQSDGVLSASLEEVAEHVHTLAWARNVSVRRQWPNQLVITLHKAQPAARWGDDRYVSTDGELLELPNQYVGLAQFDVALSDPPQAMEVYRLLGQMTDQQGLRIHRLTENERGEWQVEFHTGLRVLLGNEQISGRMRRFLSAYQRVLRDGDQQAIYVDARYSNGVAIRFAEATGPLLAATPVENVQPGEVR